MINIEKYLNNISQNENGMFYKNEEAFNSKQGICHIGELDLQILKEEHSAGNDFSDKELIELSIGDSYDTILAEINRMWDDIVDEVKANYTPEDFARIIFDAVDWTCAATEIYELTY